MCVRYCLRYARPYFACGICGNCGNADYQIVTEQMLCGNIVAICGSESKSVAMVVAMWQ